MIPVCVSCLCSGQGGRQLPAEFTSPQCLKRKRRCRGWGLGNRDVRTLPRTKVETWGRHRETLKTDFCGPSVWATVWLIRHSESTSVFCLETKPMAILITEPQTGNNGHMPVHFKGKSQFVDMRLSFAATLESSSLFEVSYFTFSRMISCCGSRAPERQKRQTLMSVFTFFPASKSPQQPLSYSPLWCPALR